MPDLIDLARQFSAAAEKRDMAALARLTSAYGRMYRRLEGQIEALAQQIGGGQMTTGQLARLTRFNSLMSQIEDELGNYSVVLDNELSAAAEDAMNRALKDSRNLINTAAQQSGIAAGFNALPTRAVTQLLGFLADNSPLFQRLSQLAPFHAAEIRALFVEGVGLGWNPRKIAAAIRRQFGMSLTDALRMTRTAQLYAYRETTRANYVASDLVVGWQWMAHLGSPRTCMSCISKSGQIFPKTQRLNDHHNGRCVAIPVIRNRDPFLSETEGVDWFNRQSATIQRERMGPRFWEAWQAGKFGLEDISHEVDNDVYGPMWQVTTLKELLGMRA